MPITGKENWQRLSEEWMQIIGQGKPKDITPAVAGKVGYNTVKKQEWWVWDMQFEHWAGGSSQLSYLWGCTCTGCELGASTMLKELQDTRWSGYWGEFNQRKSNSETKGREQMLQGFEGAWPGWGPCEHTFNPSTAQAFFCTKFQWRISDSCTPN